MQTIRINSLLNNSTIFFYRAKLIPFRNKLYLICVLCIAFFIFVGLITFSNLNAYSQSNQSQSTIPSQDLSSLIYSCSLTANDLLNTETQSECTFPRFDFNSGTLRRFEIILKGTRNTTITLTNNTKLAQSLTYYSSAEGLLLWEGIDMNSVELPLGFNTEISPIMPFVTDELTTIDESSISYTDLDILSLFVTNDSLTDDILTTLRITDTSSNIEPTFSVKSKDTTTFDVEFKYSYIPNPSLPNPLEYTPYRFDNNNLLTIQIPQLFKNSDSTALITLPQFWLLKPTSDRPLLIDDSNYPTYSLELEENQSQLQFQINSQQSKDQDIKISFLSGNPSIQPQTYIIQTNKADLSQSIIPLSQSESTIRSGGANSPITIYLVGIIVLVLTMAIYPIVLKNENSN